MIVVAHKLLNSGEIPTSIWVHISYHLELLWFARQTARNRRSSFTDGGLGLKDSFGNAARLLGVRRTRYAESSVCYGPNKVN